MIIMYILFKNIYLGLKIPYIVWFKMYAGSIKIKQTRALRGFDVK